MNHITIGITDFNRPAESSLCLQSIKEQAKFDHKVVFLTNGTEDPTYAFEFYKEGLIDKLIIRRENSGGGLALREVMNDFDLNSEYLMLVQCDQYLGRELHQKEIDSYIEMLKNDRKLFCVDLAGDQGHGAFSERVFLINKQRYNLIENTRGGPGPLANEQWTEQTIQEYVGENCLKIHHAEIAWGNNGCWSYRRNPDQSEWLHRTDTKELKLIKGPVKEKYVYPKLTDAEWADVMAMQTWPEGQIPEQEKKDSFKVWN